VESIRRELGFLRGNLLVLVASYTVFGLGSGLYEPFRSLYIRELGASPLAGRSPFQGVPEECNVEHL